MMLVSSIAFRIDSSLDARSVAKEPSVRIVAAIMITDNILQEGEILSSRFAVTRRNRTIHARMRAYIRALMEEERLETLLLPTGDGAAVSMKKANL